MKCSCIVGSYDFSLDQTNCSDIIYLDHSTWQQGADFASPPTYTLSIEDSGGKVTTHEVTVGTPLHLKDLACTPGVFQFSTISCTKKVTKKVAIICNLWCGWLRAVSKLGEVDAEIVRSIRVRLEYISLAVSYGDTQTAVELISSVTRDLKRINCSCEC